MKEKFNRLAAWFVSNRGSRIVRWILSIILGLLYFWLIIG